MDATVGTARTDMRAWSVAWLGGPVIGVANGVLRRAVLDKPFGELRAHQLSSLSAVALFAAYVRALDRRWPIATAADAARVGAAWTAATAAFEFGFGRTVAGMSWAELGRDYDLRRGRLWSLVLLTLAVAPSIARRSRLRR